MEHWTSLAKKSEFGGNGHSCWGYVVRVLEHARAVLCAQRDSPGQILLTLPEQKKFTFSRPALFETLLRALPQCYAINALHIV